MTNIMDIFYLIGFIVVGVWIVKLIDNYIEERERKKSNLTRDEYDKRKNLERRYQSERYGTGDDEEYLKVIKKLKITGFSDEFIKDLIKDSKDRGLTGVALTETLRILINEQKIKDKKRNFYEKWFDEENE